MLRNGLESTKLAPASTRSRHAHPSFFHPVAATRGPQLRMTRAAGLRMPAALRMTRAAALRMPAGLRMTRAAALRIEASAG